MRSEFSSQLHPYILNKIWFFSCDRILKQAIYVPDFSTSQNRVAPVEQLEAQLRMQYVTSFERIARIESLLKGIALGLKLKFGTPGQNLLPEIELLEDFRLLESILSAIETADTVDELRSIYQTADDTPSEN